MSEKKKNIVSEALLDMENIRKAVAEESKNTIQNLLGESIRQSIREAISDEDEPQEDDKKDPQDNLNVDDSASSDPVETQEETPEDNPTDSMPTDNDEEAEEVTDITIDDDPTDGDDFAEYSDYKKDGEDNAYDLSGEQDFDKVVSIFKKLDNQDSVIPAEDGKIQFTDDETGAEYVIDPGTSVPESTENETLNEEDLSGLDDLEDDDDYFETSSDEETPAGIPNLKEGRMQNKRKEMVFEVDLGYTDNYQSKDPIEGLSNAEPSKFGRNIDKGIPTGTKKPWAGSTNGKGKPFDTTVNECGDMPTDEPAMEEGTNVTLPNSRKKSKSHTPDTEKKNYPKNAHHDSVGGNYDAERLNENNKKTIAAYKKEIKDLREAVISLNENLNEVYMTNVKLGKITRLFMENATTKKEKAEIIERFGALKTEKDAVKLYETVSRELKSKTKTQPMLENTVKTVEGSQKINESVNNSGAIELAKIHDFMNRMDNCR